MAARKARKTTSKRSTGRKPARTGTKTSKRPKAKAPKPKAEKVKKKKAPAPARKKAPARATKPKKKVARAKAKPVRKAKPKPKARPKAVKPKARPKAKPKAAARKPKKAVRKPVKKVVARKPARKAAPSRKKVVKKAPKKVARRAQRLADLREQRRQRRLEEKAARKAAKAEKLKAAKLKAERLKEEKRERIERIRAAKREKLERIKAEKARKTEKLRAEKQAKLERIKAERLAKAEKLKAEKAAEKLKAEKAAEKAKAESKKHEARIERGSKPGALPDRKSSVGSVQAPKAPPGKGKGKESERPVKAPSQPPRTRVPLMRTPAVVIPKEPPRPPIEERATLVESRLQQQPPEVLREYEERLYMSWIHHDSALEGVVYTFQELQMAVDPAITVVPDSSIQPICDEIRRHKQAIDFVREQAKLKEPVSSDLIKRIYLFLHPEEGDLKTVKYRKDIPQHRLYFHEYAAPDKIAYGVRQVVEWINDPETARTRGALRIAARAHYDFIRIFPFQSDSGKVARLLMNYVLLLAGFPPAIIHSTERQRYYEALKGSPLSVLHMVTEALENSVASIEKFLNERATRVRSFVS